MAKSRPLGLTLGLLFATPSVGQVLLYSQNFETNSTASWTIRSGPSDSAANFFFDYSTVGIPPAPSASGTRGMKLQANLVDNTFSGMSVTPNGQSFTGDYTVRFDWWANFNGPFPGGGSGSGNLSTFGIGTAGLTAQWPGAGAGTDSVWFAATGDGNSANDYRAYSSASPLSYPSGDPVYAAPTLNHTDPYYAPLGGVSAPAAQLALYPQQSGITHVGGAGMEWHQVAITSLNGVVTWHIDGLLIATIDLDTVTLGGSNIFFGHSDFNSSSSTDPNDAALLFTLIDNVRVTRGTLYAIESGRAIHSIDPATGFKTQIATADPAADVCGGLARNHATGQIYLTSTSLDSLFLLNLSTGAVTLVGAYGDPAIVMHGLEWDRSTNTLYGESSHNNGLYTINTATGAATLVGTSGLTSFTNLGHDSNSNVMYATNSGSDSFYTVNRATGAVTLIGALNGPTNPNGLAFSPESNTLYLVDNTTDTLYTINTATGAATPVGSTASGNLLGLVYVPGQVDCPADTNNDGTVNVTDLLAVIGAWGACAICPAAPCAADINGDCQINVTDLLAVIGAWGVCQ